MVVVGEMLLVFSTITVMATCLLIPVGMVYHELEKTVGVGLIELVDVLVHMSLLLILICCSGGQRGIHNSPRVTETSQGTIYTTSTHLAVGRCWASASQCSLGISTIPVNIHENMAHNLSVLSPW